MKESTVNLLLSPPGLYLFQIYLGGGEDGRDGGGGGLFNLAKTMVSVLHKALQYTVVKPWTKKKSDLPVG